MVAILVLALSALSGGCEAEQPATEVLVVVNSDLAPSSELTKLVVRVFDRSGAEALQEREFVLSERPVPAQFSLPLSYSLTPMRGVFDFRLVATGRGPLGPGNAEMDVVEQTTIAAFRAQSRLLLPVFLGRGCLRQLCRSEGAQPGELTCDVTSGSCRPIPELPLSVAGSGPLGGLDVSAAAPGEVAATVPSGAPTSAADAGVGPSMADASVGPSAAPVVPSPSPGAGAVCDATRDIDVDCASLPDGTEIRWPTGAARGSCRAGKRSCVGGAWSACEGAITPVPSDGCEPDNDANCNGVANEGCPCLTNAQRPCGSTLGRCVAGVQTCVGGSWSATCVGGVGPEALDGCDAGDDSNCNGVPNEGCECVNGATSTCAQAVPGACGTRAIVCSAGRWPRAACTEQCDPCPPGACAGGSCARAGASWACQCGEGFTGTGSQQCTACGRWFRDCDGDGFAASDTGAVRACEMPARVAGCAAWTARAPDPGAIDCDDANTARHPGAGYGVTISSVNVDANAGLICRVVNGVPTPPCVTATTGDLNCDGRIDQRGTQFTHECSGPSDCDCWVGRLPCGVSLGAPVRFCASGMILTGQSARLAVECQ